MRISETKERQLVSTAERGDFLDRSHRDERDIGVGVEESLVFISHVDHVLATHRSAEVSDEQEHAWSQLPERCQGDGMPRMVREVQIGRAVAHCEPGWGRTFRSACVHDLFQWGTLALQSLRLSPNPLIYQLAWPFLSHSRDDSSLRSSSVSSRAT